MLTRIDLTLDCANPQLLAVFWKTAAGYVDEPPPSPFATREEWLSQFDDEFDEGWMQRGFMTQRASRLA